jgi:hypothetical protein
MDERLGLVEMSVTDTIIIFKGESNRYLRNRTL